MGSRRSGFERLRDIITKYRRSWVDLHLETYLRARWEGEIRDAAFVLDDDLTIDESGCRGKFSHRIRDVGKPLGPVEALAGQELDLAAVEPRLDAVAVELDLVNPVAEFRRLVAERRQRRGDEEPHAAACAVRRSAS